MVLHLTNSYSGDDDIGRSCLLQMIYHGGKSTIDHKHSVMESFVQTYKLLCNTEKDQA